MKTSMKTGLIAFLLLFAFACKKEAASTDANSTEKVAKTNNALVAPDDQSADLVTPPGNWMLY